MTKRLSPWKSPLIISYIIDSYAGVETNDHNKPTRKFLWSDAEGTVWISNSAAFAIHLAEKFQYQPLKYDYIEINNILLRLGERIVDITGRELTGRNTNQLPLQPKQERAK